MLLSLRHAFLRFKTFSLKTIHLQEVNRTGCVNYRIIQISSALDIQEARDLCAFGLRIIGKKYNIGNNKLSVFLSKNDELQKPIAFYTVRFSEAARINNPYGDHRENETLTYHEYIHQIKSPLINTQL